MVLPNSLVSKSDKTKKPLHCSKDFKSFCDLEFINLRIII